MFPSHVVPYNGTVHRVEYHLNITRFLGCKTYEDVEWGIYITENEKKRVKEILNEEGVAPDKPVIALHPGSRKELSVGSLKDMRLWLILSQANWGQQLY